MKANSQGVSDYISNRPVNHHERLEVVRSLISENLPETVREGIAWSMPSYWQGTYLIHFQDYGQHLNIYIGPEAVERFKTIYPRLNYSKRGFKLFHNQELPETELRDMLNWLYKTYAK
ncbi:iron chaperone [Streptococcus hongkongensis]|nr:hypothetical protein NC01_04935 [Streptococcus uberis]